VIDTFAKLFGTDDLLVSFDAVNVSLANRKDQGKVGVWAHQDQDPERGGLRCVQVSVRARRKCFLPPVNVS
jgi:hypothetical protein